MKKIFAILSAAAMACTMFTACEKDEETKKYIDDVTVTDNSVTFTVNSTGANGYTYSVIAKDVYDIVYSMNVPQEEEPTEEALTHAAKLTLTQITDEMFGALAAPIKAETLKTVKTITVDGLDAGSLYYISAVDLDAEGNYQADDLQFITVTTKGTAPTE